MQQRTVFSSVCLIVAVFFAGGSLGWAQSRPLERAQTSSSHDTGFEAHQGPAKASSSFLWRDACQAVAVASDRVDVALCQPEIAPPVSAPHRFPSVNRQRPREFSFTLVGANDRAVAQGVGLLPVKSNYLPGADPRAWRVNVPHYRQVQFAQVYPGINALYQSGRQRLRYDFIVAPRADPNRIALQFNGIDTLAIDGAGNLVIGLGSGVPVIQAKPFVYQEINGTGRPVAARYVLTGPHQAGLALGPYDTSHTLVIDPTLNFSTFLGGSGADMGTSLAVIQEGQTFVTGVTTSANFPTVGGVSSIRRGASDVFVTKYNAAGAVEFSTYLGGDGSEEGTGLAVDPAGNIYVAGTTDSANFPTTPGSFRTQLTGERDAFVVKLNAAGNGLVYGTYLGGSGADDCFGLALDLNNNTYVTGITDADNFPTTNSAFQPAKSGGSDAFLAKLNVAGTSLAYASYLGGSGTDWGMSVAVDVTGRAYVTGLTASNNFPATPGAAQLASGGGSDSFVVKLDPTLSGASSLRYATYLGGSGIDWGSSLAVDPVGNVVLAGLTNSANFPVTAGALQTAKRGSSDAFVAKLNGDGTALSYATYLGGDGADVALSLALDSAGQAFVAGGTQSLNFPTTAGAYQTATAGRSDAFVTKVNYDGTALLTSSYLGGGQDEEALGVAPRIASRAYVTGSTNSANFPTATPAQSTLGGGTDAFVANLGDTATTTPIEAARFFVRQHYLDFLSRDPDAGGWDYWTGQITQCGADANCLRAQRVVVSNAFFFELEFQQTGAFVYRLYKASYGTTAGYRPSYAQFVVDRARVAGGPNLLADKLVLANDFVQRPEFLARYPASLTGAQFVDAVLATVQQGSGVNLSSQRAALISLFNSGGRGLVLRELVDDRAGNPVANMPLLDAEYNRSFVLTQYFGYLRRDPDQGGYDFWLGIVNRYPIRSLNGQNAMVCAFITAQEYQERFSGLAPRNNGECPPAP